MKITDGNTTIIIKICRNIFDRFKGLMFKKNISYGLCFPKCNSIHTFFMSKPIDVIMTDKEYKVLFKMFIIHLNYQ